MKRLFAGLALAVFAALSHAATLNPIQLLNPAGSTSGQTIVSTGSSTAPAWASVPISGLSSIASNTVLANATGSSSAPTAFSMPSCSTSSSALQYTSGSGFTCYANSASTTGTLAQFAATTSAQLASVLSDETGSGASVFALTPTLTAPNIIGTISGGNAAAGSVGEYVTASFSAVNMTSNTNANLTSISLTAGDWDVTGFVGYTAANTTAVTAVVAGTSLTSATLPAIGTYNQQTASWPTNGAVIGVPAPVRRVSVSSTTTVYMVGLAIFSTSTLNATGFIQARRVR